VAFGFARAVEAAMDPATPNGIAPDSRGPVFEPTLWFSLDGEGLVSVNIIRAEMGQHVGTAIARILADELEADWDKVRIIHVDTDPKWGYMVTGGSWSVWQSWPIFSRAGAAGRITLIEEGAKLLGVAPEVCTARHGAVLAGGQSIPYAEIVRHGKLDRRYTADELAKPHLPASERRLSRPARRWTYRRRPTAAGATASMRRSQAWSMPGRRSRRRATGRRWSRSTTAWQGR
jgi:CO/xanthine dehydrogenase Mo-binding subunit